MDFEKRNETRLTPEDPRLTAYAFGGLEGEELAATEAAIAADPRLARRVAELRVFGAEIGAALENEPMPAMPEPASPGTPAAPGERGRVLRFPAWAWATAGLAAAAALAVMAWLRQGGTTPDAPGVAKVEAKPTLAGPVAPRVATTNPGEAEPPMPPAPKKDQEAAAPEAAVAVRQPSEPAPAVIPEPVIADPGPSPAPDAGLLASMPARTLPAVAASLAADPRTEVRAMLDKGRSRYAAGDLDGAAALFGAVKKIDARNREAGYFSTRISQEKAWARNGAERPAPAAPFPVGGLSPSRMTSAPRPLAEPGFVPAQSSPVSTFPPNVDTAGYSRIRRAIRSGSRIPGLPDSRLLRQQAEVRIEELINYFPYRYASPVADGTGPEEAFSAHLAVAAAPWAPDHRLVRVGLKAAELASAERPAANLVFVADISTSMTAPGSLSLVKVALLQMLGGLRPDDRVAIVAFGTEARLVLPSTPAENRAAIQDAIRGLRARGSTNAEAGLELGYEVAQEHFAPVGVNRVIFCTDGHFSTKASDGRPMTGFIREKAGKGVFLTVLGFGKSNFPAHDDNLRNYARSGNGVFGYVDSPAEARKILTDEVEGTLATIAKRAKIQVEFNPQRVASYRLIGYEKRAGDFNDPSVDAGEICAGHAITALYEIIPVKIRSKKRAAAATDRLLTVKLSYQDPLDEAGTSRTQEFALADAEVDFRDADEDFRFAAAVAAWGMLLRGSPYAGAATMDDVRRWARDCRTYDPGDYRDEFIDLVRQSRSYYDLTATPSTRTPPGR